jgi:hypothetical protein
LLLSDRPFLLHDPMGDECLLALPLCPTVLFLASNTPLDVVASSVLVEHVNQASVECAAQRLYGTGAQHLDLVEQYLLRTTLTER